ncbi:MAG: sensor domain-containing diguanylate cyclase [Anaerolineae bacterium]|nr:sensor domain-containing diguanylate cyclase [Anaerolineae bacterium]
MENQSQFYKSLLDNLYDGVYFVDTERKITYWNKGAEKITGYTAEQVMDKFCRDNILNHCTENGEELCLHNCPLTKSIQSGAHVEAEVFLHHADGHRVPVLVRTSPIIEDGKVIGAVEIFSNSSRLINARRRAQEMEIMALKDILTGVANRRAGESRLEAMLLEFAQNQQPFALLFADIDNFKHVNDRFGHEIGDKVLQMIAKTLSLNLRQNDLVSRWGGEEFVALIRGVDQKGMQQTANKLLMLTQKTRLDLKDQEVSVTLSIGATLSRKGDTLEEIIQRSDALMYESKKNGRNRATFG